MIEFFELPLWVMLAFYYLVRRRNEKARLWTKVELQLCSAHLRLLKLGVPEGRTRVEKYLSHRIVDEIDRLLQICDVLLIFGVIGMIPGGQHVTAVESGESSTTEV